MENATQPVRAADTASGAASDPGRAPRFDQPCQLGRWGCIYGPPYDGLKSGRPGEDAREGNLPWQIDAAILGAAALAVLVLVLVGCPLF